jgi:hypothetical protein
MIIYNENIDYRKLDKSLQRLLEQVGGSPTSSHLKGLAIDLNCNNDTERYQLLFATLACGFKRIGIGRNHIHLDCDNLKPQGLVFFDKL